MHAARTHLARPLPCAARAQGGRAWRSSSSRAFTLIEVLIAIALMLLLGGAMFTFLNDLLATRSRTLHRAMQQRAASTLIERLEGDLACTLVGDSAIGAGIRGEETSIRLLTRGVMSQFASRGLDDPAALGDLQKVEYRFDPMQRMLLAGKAPRGEYLSLATLGGEVQRVRFRYLDMGQWQPSFDSIVAGRLPEAVEVAIWHHQPSDENGDGEDGMATQTSAPEVGAARAANISSAARAASTGQPQSPPDRLRVIAIPDGGGE